MAAGTGRNMCVDARIKRLFWPENPPRSVGGTDRQSIGRSEATLDTRSKKDFCIGQRTAFHIEDLDQEVLDH